MTPRCMYMRMCTACTVTAHLSTLNAYDVLNHKHLLTWTYVIHTIHNTGTLDLQQHIQLADLSGVLGAPIPLPISLGLCCSVGALRMLPTTATSATSSSTAISSGSRKSRINDRFFLGTFHTAFTNRKIYFVCAVCVITALASLHTLNGKYILYAQVRVRVTLASSRAVAVPTHTVHCVHSYRSYFHCTRCAHLTLVSKIYVHM
jgi:hypothetical protein